LELDNTVSSIGYMKFRLRRFRPGLFEMERY